MMFGMMLMLVVMVLMSDVDKMRNGVRGDSEALVEVQMRHRTPPYQLPCISCMTNMAMVITMIIITICTSVITISIIKCRAATFVSSVREQLGQLRPKDRRLGCGLLKMILLMTRTKKMLAMLLFMMIMGNIF